MFHFTKFLRRGGPDYALGAFRFELLPGCLCENPRVLQDPLFYPEWLRDTGGGTCWIRGRAKGLC